MRKCVLAGFSDHLAKRLDQGTLRCELVHARRGVLARESAMQQATLLVAAEVAEPEPETPDLAPDLAPEGESGPAEPASDEPVQVSEGVRLLATQMSVAGASSADIAKRLHNDFGVQDADRLIAQLFGSGSDAPR